MLIEQFFINPVNILIYIIIIIFSLVVHELAHGFAAIYQGDDTPIKKGHITLNPVIHMGWLGVDPSKFRDRKWSDIIVSVAGPISNLVLAFIFLIFKKINIALSLDEFSSNFFYIGAITNFSLCFFNLIPCPSLDGFHICAQFFPDLKAFEKNPWALLALIMLYNVGLGAFILRLSQTIVMNAIGS